MVQRVSAVYEECSVLLTNEHRYWSFNGMVEEQVVPRELNMQRLHELKVPYLSVFVNVRSKDTTALVKNSRRRSFKA